MSFHDVVSVGIRKIYSEDFNTQKHYITTICKDVRNMSPDIVFKAQGVFIPNNDYMSHFFGEESLDDKYNLYTFMGECLWQENIIFPIKNLTERVMGLVGYNPIVALTAKESGDWSANYYTYSNKMVFDRGKYIYMIDGAYERALKEGYMIYVDGTFDMLSLASHDFISGSLLGSSMSMEVLSQMRFIRKKYLAYDNDDAGTLLYQRLKRVFPDLIGIQQNKDKDMDGLLKSSYGQKAISFIREHIRNNSKTDILLRF